MCCVVLWFKLKYKVNIKLLGNTASAKEIQERTYILLAQTSDRKRDTLDRKLLLSALEATLK